MLTWPAPQIPQLPGRGDPVRVRDTSTGRLVVAAPGPAATLYVCGITPYDATHLGHAATYVAFDLLGRAWRDAGQRVRYASNVTDVDDPLLERAAATGVDWRDLAAEQTALFAEDMTALGVIPPDVYLGAVEAIPAVVDAVEELLAAGAAYRVPHADAPADDGLGDVYADLTADSAFGAVAGLDDDTMRDAVRRARRRPRACRQARTARPAAVAPRASGRARLGRRRARHRPSRLAHRVRGHRPRRARAALRRPGRRLRPAVPAPRDEHVARPAARRRATARGSTCTPAWSGSTGRR